MPSISFGVSIRRFHPDSVLGMLNDMKTPLPPPHEREMIVTYLDQATARFDQAIIRTKHQINLLNEYSTRLIADVVTGQIDVRNSRN